jgi:hypothetical protein
MQKLLSEKRQQLWAAWVHEVKRRSKIDVAQELG